MTEALGLPQEILPAMQAEAMWAAMEQEAHTLAYDGEIVEGTQAGTPLPMHRVERWQVAAMPVQVIGGEASEPFFADGARMLADALPNAEHHVLSGQGHDVAADALAPMLADLYGR